jgi:hypothetical protein
MKSALAVLICVLTSAAVAQQVCPTTQRSGNLICLIPQIYGKNGLTLPNPFHSAHFDSDFESSFTPLNAAIGTQLTALPIASPASGFTFTFDRTLGVFTRSTESYGPVLTERAETIGRHKLFVAFTYQHFGFSDLDGIDMRHIPATYTHIDCCNANGFDRQPGDPPSPGVPTFEQEYITTDNWLDLKVNQFTFFATYGLTSRMDVSVAVPIMDVHFNVTSMAHIVRKAPPSRFGYAHYFDPACIGNLACQAASTDAVFFDSGSATGIGDVVFRLKGTVYRGERFHVALGTDVRVPSGDEMNFLGSGAWGVKPFVSASYPARISPHVNVGVLVNGNSILAGDLATNTEDRLPTEFLYSGGADFGLTKRLTLAADIIGQHVFDAPQASKTPYVDILGQTQPGIFTTTISKGSLDLVDLALGAKISPTRHLLLSANALIKLNDAGLRANVVPLVGISYTF